MIDRRDRDRILRRQMDALLAERDRIDTAIAHKQVEILAFMRDAAVACELAPAKDVLEIRRNEWAALHHGGRPSLVYVTCGNTVCVRPEHLTITPVMPPAPPAPTPRPGPRYREPRPKIEHADYPNRKLTPDQVRAIRGIRGSFTKEHADRFGVSRQQLSNVRNRVSWADVPDDPGGDDA
jgi:hypothetical protein